MPKYGLWENENTGILLLQLETNLHINNNNIVQKCRHRQNQYFADIMNNINNGFKSQCPHHMLILYSQSLFEATQQVFLPMPAGAGQLIPMVQRRYFWFHDYEIIFGDTQVAPFCTWIIRSGMGWYFPFNGINYVFIFQ